jgi:hypothetical protein
LPHFSRQESRSKGLAYEVCHFAVGAETSWRSWGALAGAVAHWALAKEAVDRLRQSEFPGGMAHACEFETSLYMRHMLLRLARDRVKAPKEAEATFIATHKVFDKEIRRICKGLYPKRDMEILKKYHAAHQQPFIDLIVPGEVPRFDRFHFVGHSWETARSGTTDLPWVPKHIEHGRVNLDERASMAFQAYASAAAEREMARNELLGTFETAIAVPELKQAPVKVSSLVLGTQLRSAEGTKTTSPLVRDGIELVPNLTHIVGRDQKLYFYFEVYDPAAENGASRLRTSLAFYRGKVKVFETPVTERTQVDAADRHAAIFRLELGAGSFTPGLYICQVNIIDELAGTFAFPRLQLYVR